jgi:tetratricopeptide (TPR) repeat protein
VAKVLQINDLGGEGRVQLSLLDGSECQSAPPVPFRNPLEESDYREIAWYFQEYLEDPSPGSDRRAEAVETGLRNLGRLLFEGIFRGNEAAIAFYAAACRDGLDDYQLVIKSADPQFHALPWESLNEPEKGYLAAHFPSVVREPVLRGKDPLPPFTGQLPTEQLNVLLVSPYPILEGGKISPFGRNDILEGIRPNPPTEQGESPISQPFSKVGLAAETLTVLESLEVSVELDFVRPPTFDALVEQLTQHPGKYHVVQLDGITTAESGAKLIFEAAEGSPDPVPAARLAEVLTAAGVPVVLVSSGGGGLDGRHDAWGGETAARLAVGGVPLVVSVPFPLAAPARERFIQRFYPAIVQGTDICAAVSQARRAMMESPHRSALAGKVVFWDWLAPAVYRSRAYTPPVIDKPAPADLTPLPAQRREGPRLEDQMPRGGPHGLLGRRGDLHRLERLFNISPLVLLAGNAGTGKTELALGLARWLQKTGGRPGGVFYTTFEAGAGLERVVHEAGTAVAGLEFADMGALQQRQWLVEYLRARPSLLIWDALENVAGSSTGGPGLLSEPEQSALDAFLAEVAGGGATWVLLVSRRKEQRWLSNPHLVHELAGLDPPDRLELGWKILERSGLLESSPGQRSGPRLNGPRLGPEYLHLLELLDGHPLAMQIALPLLKEAPATVLFSEITKHLDQLSPDDGEDARDPILTAVMDYSFSRMSHRSRVHLPFLSLFHRRVMMDILTHMTQESVYRRVMGEELGWGACRTLLRSASDAGFLEPVTPSVYQIQPGLPWFYGRRLHRQVSAPGVRQLEQEFVRVYADTADYFMETLYENQESGATAVLAEESNLTQALALTLESEQWDTAQLLVQPLAQVYRMQKRYPELRRLRRQLLEAVSPTGGGAGEAEGRGGIGLWLYLTGTEASEATDLGELDYAEELNQRLLDYLTALPNGETDPRTAAAYHQLGLIALNRRQLAEAEERFRQSLAIIESGDDQAAIADDCSSLGQVMQYQRRYTEAKDWFRKALEVHQRLQDQEEMVKDYRALGLAAQYRFEYEEAESWYQRARAIVEENRDEETAVLVFHELGTVCHARYQYDEAESWYQQALTLSDRLGKEEQMAVEFHHLGLLAQTRQLFYDDAENWYLLALEKYEKIGNRPAAGDECRQLGVLFHEQKRLQEAEGWYHRAREIFEEVHDVSRTARTYGQLAMVAEEGGDLSSALEWVARTYRLAAEHDLPMMAQIKAHLARLKEKYGAGEFIRWWRGYTGGDPPADLDVDAGPIL